MGDDLNERIRRDSFEGPPSWPPQFGPDDDRDVLIGLGCMVVWSVACVAIGYWIGVTW